MEPNASPYLLIFRDSSPERYEAMSAEQRQQLLQQWNAWVEGLAAQGKSAMPKHVTSAERYRQLAEECLDVAQNFPLGTARDTLLQMAQVWQRLGGHVPRSRRRHLALGVGQRSPALSPT